MENSIYYKRENWDSTGVIVESELISKTDVESVIEDLNRFLKENKDNLEEGKEVNYANFEKTIVNSFHRLENHQGYFFNDLAKRSNIVDIAEELLKDKAELLSIQAFVKPGDIGLETPYHQDNAYWCIEPANGLTIWIALDKCDKTNGMIKYVTGIHNIGVVEHTPSLAPGSSQIIEDKNLPAGEVFNPSLNPGDAAIHHTMNIHGSNPNNSGKQRRGLLLCYKGEKTKRNMELFDRYQKNLDRVMELRNS
jgi:ectoine hydroxylase-related dioxygenase (phytanoyl-CoA dioxygenase family)